jgi:TPR repeat protein
MGVCHSEGRGVRQDHSVAANWYRSAAMQDHGPAQSTLGACYHHGQGVVQDLGEAYAWSSLAARTEPRAGERRDELARQMSAPQLAAGKQRTEELRAQIAATRERNVK